MSHWGSPTPKKRKYNRFWDKTRTMTAREEIKNYGMDYVVQKYGQERANQLAPQAERDTRSPGRSGGGGYTTYIPGMGYRKIGSSARNAPPRANSSRYNPTKNVIAGGRFRDGGPAAPKPPGPPGPPAPPPPDPFGPRLKLNLDNDLNLAQGYQHEWAQPTSISSTITGLLRQAQNASPNYWEQWALDKPGKTTVTPRPGGSSFGMDMQYKPKTGASASLATSNPFGGFGTNMIMQPQAYEQGYMYAMGQPADPPTTPPPTQPPSTPPGNIPPGNTDSGPVPPVYSTDGPIVPGDINPPKPSGVYNPWSRGEGGEVNAYGPSQNYMGNATLQAMSLANAYFAPQRMELAYELGDMETDMRRLAVNLGRQVDDPVLQAKMFKEATRAVRTLDVQQNTFAFQMAEQRRREELQNFQFYDQLGQEEYRLRLANRQFYERLELDRRYYNLQNWNVMHPPTAPTGTGPSTTPPQVIPPGGNPAPGMYQGQFGGMPQPAQAPPSTAGMYAAQLGATNPYVPQRAVGQGNITQSVYPY